MSNENLRAVPYVIQIPVTYEPESKTIYQAGGYGVVARVDEYTHDADEGIGSTEYDELCNRAGLFIQDAINYYAQLREQNRILIEQCEKYQSLLADIKTSHEGYAGHPVYNPGIFNAQQIDENYEQVTKALKAAEEVK